MAGILVTGKTVMKNTTKAAPTDTLRAIAEKLRVIDDKAFWNATDEIDWVRGLEVGRRAQGVAYVDGVLSEVKIWADGLNGVQVATAAIQRSEASRMMLSLLQTEIDFGLSPLLTDAGTIAWLKSLQEN